MSKSKSDVSPAVVFTRAASASARAGFRAGLALAVSLAIPASMLSGLNLPGLNVGIAHAADPAAATAAGSQAQATGPREIITQVAQETLEELDRNRAEYRKDPRRLRELVDRIMLPHFDTQYAAQLVLARHWRSATPQQRERFIEAFYQSMLLSYGEALLEFTPDRLRVLPHQGKPDDRVTTVRSEVRRDDGSRVPVNYSLRKTPEGWKAYDVQIEGVSYVKSLRTDFGAEIEQRGLEAVIERLESQVSSGTANKALSAASARATTPSAGSASKSP